MRGRNPMTQTIKASEVRSNWSDVLNRVFRGETRVIVEKSGIPAVAIISARDLERLTMFEAARAEAFRPLFETGDAFQDVPMEELEREVARALQDARRARRAEEEHASRAR